MTHINGKKRWDVALPDPFAVAAIMEECKVSSLCAKVMAARGITVEEAGHFLQPSLERDWRDPYIIPHMAEAVEKVSAAIREQKKIAVFGDFDVDGISAATVLTLALRELGARVGVFIPRRFDEGYGLSHEALNRVIESSHPELIVTVDTGISSRDEVDFLLGEGIDVIVTDHHEPSDKVPQGVPILDPKLYPGCLSREIAGVGVALKLVQALGAEFGKPDLWRRYTDIACLGTVSDMMRLDTENRSLVQDGIEQLRYGRRPGYVALASVSNIELGDLSAESLSYSLIPRLNAAGRMADPKLALELLMSQDPFEADKLAEELEEINTERRDMEAEFTAQAISLAEATYSGGRVVVIGAEGWHEGVKGIVASRIVHHFHVPALIFSISDGVARGSGRSVGSVDLFKAVERCSDLLIQFGGHAGAVGVTLDATNLDALRERLEEILSELDPEEFEDHGVVDAELELAELTLDNIQSLDILRPFGQGNPTPLFALRGAVMERKARVGRENEHLRFSASDGCHQVSCIMFRAPNIEALAEYSGAVDLIFEVVAETWQGRTNVKLMVKDIVCRNEVVSGKPSCPELVEELFSKAADIIQRGEFSGLSDALSFHTKLSGVSFDGRQELIKDLEPQTRLRVVRDKHNPYDENAISVQLQDGSSLGFLNRRLAAALAPLMDKGAAYYAEVVNRSDPARGKFMGVNITLHREHAADTEELGLSREKHQQTREKLSQLSDIELDNALRELFIGKSDLLPAQKQALDNLAQGYNSLCIMATGRGKSLIFHLHAARGAIKHRVVSVFVYPLRALVNDQIYHLEKNFKEIGLVSRVLTGETSAADRDILFAAMNQGEIDIILTTPEFLSIHRERFALCKSLRFVVVDEAHHAAEARSGNRAAYNDMPEILECLSLPQVLAVTATADDEAALRIQELLGIQKLVIDNTERENLLLDDSRERKDKDVRLISIVARGEKTIIYVNSREQSVSIAAMLRKRIAELGSRIAYYNAGLSRQDRYKIEDAFRKDELCCIVATSAFGEGVNLPDVRHVVLYHMPFGAVEFNQMAGRAGRDRMEAWVHLLFGSHDAGINERILASGAPDRDELINLYRVLQEQHVHADRRGEEGFSKTNAELSACCKEQQRRCNLDERSVSCGISIFKELGFLTTQGYGSSRQIFFNIKPQKVELETSIRYKEGLHAKEEFLGFRDWVLHATARELLERFNKPITPQDLC